MRILCGSLTLIAAVALSPAAGADDVQAELDAASHAYTIDLPAKLSMKVGETGALHVVVIPKAGDHVSPDAPVSLTATAPKPEDPALPFALPKLKLLRDDSKSTAAQGVEFSLPVVGQAVGKGELSATLVFYICVEKLCAHQKRVLSVPVQVE